MHATGHETFLTTTDQLPGRSLTGSRLDGRVVELVSANVGAPLGQRRVRQRAGFPVTEREPVRHRGLGVEHAAHRMPVQLAHQVQ